MMHYRRRSPKSQLSMEDGTVHYRSRSPKSQMSMEDGTVHYRSRSPKSQLSIEDGTRQKCTVYTYTVYKYTSL